MDSIGERVRILIEKLGIAKSRFAEEIGVKPSSISHLLQGRNGIRDTTIAMICRTYNVSEEWLRTGEGEMFRAKTLEEEVAALIGTSISEDDPVRMTLIKAICTLPKEDLDAILRVAQNVARMYPKRDK